MEEGLQMWTTDDPEEEPEISCSKIEELALKDRLLSINSIPRRFGLQHSARHNAYEQMRKIDS